MLKNLIKFGKKTEGFTLTEVMIGMMILTVAIVSATNLLVGLISTNQNNLTTMQAYYFAQEGLEAVRNIRDTNWLHNTEWLGKNSSQLWGASFDPSEAYSVDLQRNGFDQGAADLALKNMATYAPWKISKGQGNEIFWLSSDNSSSDKKSGFTRVISIKPYDCDKLGCSEDDKNKYVLVESKITWKMGSKQRDLTISEVLTDWKGGAM